MAIIFLAGMLAGLLLGYIGFRKETKTNGVIQIKPSDNGGKSSETVVYLFDSYEDLKRQKNGMLRFDFVPNEDTEESSK